MQWKKAQRDSTSTLSCVAFLCSSRLTVHSAHVVRAEVSCVISQGLCSLASAWAGPGHALQGIDEEWEEHKDRPRSWAPSLPGSGLLGAVSLQGKPQLPLPWGWKASWELYLALLFLNPAMYL